jgi:transketolase
MERREAYEAMATSLRCLSVDMVEAAKSGHPGLPLGMADVMALLFGKYLKHDPKDPTWDDRDRFVLSAGHGSALLYATLHLTGYDLCLADLRQFRQLDSKTAGHPEYGHTVGVETTTGPLGAGFATAVGMAIAEANLAKRFNSSSYRIVDHKTYVMMGDGCMMEGLTSEAASLAGHLGLGKLIAIYDDNSISIEGSTTLAFTENVQMRFESYGWQVIRLDAHDFNSIDAALAKACLQKDGDKPLLIMAKSTIGKGAPNKQGSHAVHGTPLGMDEIKAMRTQLGVPVEADFYIDSKASQLASERLETLAVVHKEYQSMMLRWQQEFASEDRLWREIHTLENPKILQQQWCSLFNVGDTVATRVASGKILQKVADTLPALIGGSADLAPSNNTSIETWKQSFSMQHRDSSLMRFGVREHAMASISTGLQLHGGFRAFCATFLIFSDYMRHAIRLAALMNQPVIYVLTHDSIYVGEDGPTHQPIEQIESLRLIPNLTVLRPADAQETAWAWQWALAHTTGPVVLALSRQDLPVLQKPAEWQKALDKGGYIAYEPDSDPQLIILATGSEVSLAVQVAQKSSTMVRVVSISCRKILEQNRAHYLHLVGKDIPVMSAEAGVRGGWALLAPAGALSLEGFGRSGKASEVARALGVSESALLQIIATTIG